MIFVFGSNEEGRHGAGAALYAKENHGAKHGVGFGLQGNSFAIPTKATPYYTLPLRNIKRYVDKFIEFAKDNQDLTFNVTRIGCGYAGYTDKDIAPMFKDAPNNCILPEGWRNENTTP